MIGQGLIDSNIGIELANDPDDLLEFLLEDSAKEQRRREREAEEKVRRRTDFRDVGYDVGRAARREPKKPSQQQDTG